jgi:hypothetical protein
MVELMNELAMIFVGLLVFVMSWFVLLFFGAFDDLLTRRKRILEARK